MAKPGTGRTGDPARAGQEMTIAAFADVPAEVCETRDDLPRTPDVRGGRKPFGYIADFSADSAMELLLLSGRSPGRPAPSV